MSSGPLIGFTGSAEEGNVTEDEGQGGYRHCWGKPCAGMFQRFSIEVGIVHLPRIVSSHELTRPAFAQMPSSQVTPRPPNPVPLIAFLEQERSGLYQ
jgi:hypothetical protein